MTQQQVSIVRISLPLAPLTLHSVRSAVISYLFACYSHGAFVISIEDHRSSMLRIQQNTHLEDLRHCGMVWQNHQILVRAKRHTAYMERIQHLLDARYAYYCSCRLQQGLFDETSIPAQRCAGICYAQAAPSATAVVRLRIHPKLYLGIRDRFLGRIDAVSDSIDDFIIADGDDRPTQAFADVIDDLDMGVTHAIHEVDRLDTTMRAMLICRYLRATPPQYCHLPSITQDDSCLALSIAQLRESGIVPEAIMAFLALSTTAQLEKLIPRAGLASIIPPDYTPVYRIPPTLEALRKLNRSCIRIKSDDELHQLARSFLQARSIPWNGAKDQRLQQSIGMLKGRLTSMEDILTIGGGLFTDNYACDNQWDTIPPATHAAIRALVGVLAQVQESGWNKERLEQVTRETAINQQVPPAHVLSAMRIALTGQDSGPGIFQIAEILGKQLTLTRLMGTGAEPIEGTKV